MCDMACHTFRAFCRSFAAPVYVRAMPAKFEEIHAHDFEAWPAVAQRPAVMPDFTIDDVQLVILLDMIDPERTPPTTAVREQITTELRGLAEMWGLV